MEGSLCQRNLPNLHDSFQCVKGKNKAQSQVGSLKHFLIGITYKTIHEICSSIWTILLIVQQWYLGGHVSYVKLQCIALTHIDTSCSIHSVLLLWSVFFATVGDPTKNFWELQWLLQQNNTTSNQIIWRAYIYYLWQTSFLTLTGVSWKRYMALFNHNVNSCHIRTWNEFCGPIESYPRLAYTEMKTNWWLFLYIFTKIKELTSVLS